MDTKSLFRLSSVLAGVGFLALTAGFLAGWEPVRSLWPFILDETRLGTTFLASITIAIALPALWVGATGSIRSAAAGTIDLAVMFALMGWYLFARSADRPELVGYGIGAVVAGVVMLAAFAYAQRQPWADPRPMPRWILAAFVVFCVLLVLVATQLVRQVPNIFPWPLAPESSVMYGFIFYGAAVYFLVGVVERHRAAATGQLIGFLAYDAVLVVPFIRRFAEVPAEHRLSLVIYTTVVVGSGVVAAVFLLGELRAGLRSHRTGDHGPPALSPT